MSCSNIYAFAVILEFVVNYNLPFIMKITFKKYFQVCYSIFDE